MKPDIYSTFWAELADSVMLGENERVPYVRHDIYKSEWKAIGTIFVKGFLAEGNIPLYLSKVFV